MNIMSNSNITTENKPQIKEFEFSNEFLKELEEVKPSNEFEKLPKNILSEIFCYLNLKDLNKIWKMNKFFLKLLCDSNCATIVWKHFCKVLIDFKEENNKNEVDEFLKGNKFSTIENKMNKYCLFLKHYLHSMKFDQKRTGKYIVISEDRKSFEINSGGNWISSFLENQFSKGIHYFEFEVLASCSFVFL